jgi:hypothetical protein
MRIALCSCNVVALCSAQLAILMKINLPRALFVVSGDDALRSACIYGNAQMGRADAVA